METTCPRFELEFDKLRPGLSLIGSYRGVPASAEDSQAAEADVPSVERLRGWLRAKFQRKPESALSKIRRMTREEALAVVDSYFWFHSIDLGDGITTPGQKTPRVMAIEFENTFAKVDLTNKSVLDIGAWNGGFSVEAMRRGAARVVALDHHTWNHSELRGRETFELVCRAIGYQSAQGTPAQTTSLRPQ